jgi:ATP-dependent protease ClpP protease subunit
VYIIYFPFNGKITAFILLNNTLNIFLHKIIKEMAIINVNGVIGQDYTYKQFITDYANCKDEQIRLLINSPGGYVDEGENIAEFIRQHATRFMSVSNSGDVASIAASIFLALPFEKRFFDLSKGVALIHNPMFQPNEAESFTADELALLSDSMAVAEKQIKSYISKQTGADSDVVGALMKINEPLNEAQLQSINFANIIKFQSVAYLKTNNDMTNEELKEHSSLLGRLIAKLDEKLFGKKVAIMLTDANGVQIEFPEVAEGGTVVVGDKTTAADGEYVMADGFTYVIVSGVVSEIKEPAAQDDENMEALKAENEALKAELDGLKAQAITAQSTIDDVKAQVIAMQGKIKSQMIDDPAGEPTPKTTDNRITDLKNKFKN